MAFRQTKIVVGKLKGIITTVRKVEGRVTRRSRHRYSRKCGPVFCLENKGSMNPH